MLLTVLINSAFPAEIAGHAEGTHVSTALIQLLLRHFAVGYIIEPDTIFGVNPVTHEPKVTTPLSPPGIEILVPGNS